MKFFNILAFVITAFTTNAQTPLIYHKSHAGAPVSYFMDPSSNYGAIKMNPSLETWEENSIPKITEVFIPLNDSVILKRTSSGRSINAVEIKTDTLANKNRYSVFEFQHKYNDSIRQNNLKKWSFQYATQSLNTPATPAKKKKKSYLLFLFGITGGGMLILKVFSQSKTINPSIA